MEKSSVKGVMQGIADGLRASQGGSSSDLNSTDYKVNASTKDGGNIDLTGHASTSGK